MSKVENSTTPPANVHDRGFYCGFDWARNDHYFVLKDGSHNTLDEGYFPNSAEGFESFFARLNHHREGQPVAVIIEGSRGSAMTLLSLVEWITLYSVNPSKTRKLIELDGSGKGKNDPRDSHLLCDYLIANHAKLRIEHESDPNILALREWVITEDELIADITRFKNRILAQIAQFCPELADIVAGRLDAEAYTKYLRLFDPRKPATDQRVLKHFQKYNVHIKKSLERILTKHRNLKVFPLGKELLVLHVEKLQSLVRRLESTQYELGICQNEITTIFSALPDARIYQSLPGLGNRLAPRMAALFGRQPAKSFANKREVNAYFGQSPVTESSGGKSADRKRPNDPDKKQVIKRRSCNRLARRTVYLWSRATACLSDVHAPWQRQYLVRCKDRGDKMPTRYRKLGKKMMEILYTCLVNGEPYSEETYFKNSRQNR